MFECDRDRDLIEVMGEATRYESTCIAQRLLAVAELYTRHQGALADMEWCLVDYCAATAADVSAVQNISHARAVGQVQFACALAHRLPSVAKVFLRGTIDFRMVSTIIHRTDNVDDALMPQLDEAIARHCEKWMRLSRPKLQDRVDQWVAKFDPAAVRVPPKVDDNRYFDVDEAGPGMAFASGHVRAADAAALDARLDALAATVCEHDPRARSQRRADAAGALARMEATLACECGREDCTAAAAQAEGNSAAATAVIHVLAEQGTLDGSSDNPGYLRGFGILPAESVREVAKTAKLKPLTMPAGVTPDPGYRPTAKTREFLQWRDLTCRWPGCDKPVSKCDVDHTVPWPHGPTHPSNTKHYCRIHHLVKTFCGWSDQQLPDGTIVLTSPTGYIFTTEAHGAAMFPTMATPTGELDLPLQAADLGADRLAMMPRRKQTRAQDRQVRINAERRERTELIAEEERQHQAWLAAIYKPPPF
ncbi:HNH endonuclease signature motif containing protein [Mycobacterium sp. NPDC051804]|uniref:HNH endonuclease signature motif containing protein n=1 Tax=Mycobacterium sp. NPDC051804 TaxID=3364295 RepID=UPI0037ACF69F